jgi:Fungal protein kinase
MWWRRQLSWARWIPNYRAKFFFRGYRTLENDLDQPTMILHRLILRTVGCPLWDYTSDRDLLAGFPDALILEGECLLITIYRHLHPAHRTLCDRENLHRDISAGNILLTETQDNDGRCGLITDLEFAHIQGSTLRRRPVVIGQHTTFESAVEAK